VCEESADDANFLALPNTYQIPVCPGRTHSLHSESEKELIVPHDLAVCTLKENSSKALKQ
jgi:hypothetical protein